MAQNHPPATPSPDRNQRNAKGEWRPDYPVTYAPLIAWPWNPWKVIKWFFTYPGFAWPLNSILLVISALSWWFTQPPIHTCADFHWSWMLWIFVRNQALVWGFYGAYYLWLYVWKKEGTNGKYDARWPARNSRVFLFNDQIKDNIFWTAGVSTFIWTCLEWITMWMYANHFLPYLDWATHPVWFCVWILVTPLWREFHFYWVHRAIHWKPIYKHVHYLHHKNINPNPWSGMAMHPIEGFLYLSVCLIHWIVPSHPFHFLFNLQHAALGPAGGHSGFEGPIMEGKFPTGSYFHYLHHRYFECNYGEATLPLDKWFGTFRDGLPTGSGAKLKEEHQYSKTSEKSAEQTSPGPDESAAV